MRGTPGSCHHSQSTPDISVNSRETCFPCTASTFEPRIDSQHGGTWDSPVGKPREKATDPLIHSTGRMTLLLQLGGKALFNAPTRMRTDSPGEIPEEPQDPCQHWRGILRFQYRPTQGLRPGIDGRGIPRGHRATPMGTGLSCGHQSGSLRSPS